MPTLQECLADRPSWDSLFFTEAFLWAKRSFDPSSQVGCVIVNPDNIPVAHGYNGPIRGVDSSDPEIATALVTRPDKYFYQEHGERNAIYNALRTGTSVLECTLYVTAMPCADCCRAICQSGIKNVKVFKKSNDFWAHNQSWVAGQGPTLKMFKAAGVTLQIIDPPLVATISNRINGSTIEFA